jgi:hypothetical protein
MTLDGGEREMQPEGMPGGIRFSVKGEACSLPDPGWYAEALRIILDPQAPLREEAQVLWLLEGYEEAGRLLADLAPGVAVANTETLRSRLKTVIVLGPGIRHRAALFQNALEDPVVISIGGEKPAQGGPAPALSVENLVVLEDESLSQAAVLAGILASLLQASPSFGGAEAIAALVQLAHSSLRAPASLGKRVNITPISEPGPPSSR